MQGNICKLLRPVVISASFENVSGHYLLESKLFADFAKNKPQSDHWTEISTTTNSVDTNTYVCTYHRLNRIFFFPSSTLDCTDYSSRNFFFYPIPYCIGSC